MNTRKTTYSNYKEEINLTAKTKNLSYNGNKNILNRVAYKLVKNGKSYKHSDSITINGKKKTYKEIIAQIKKNGRNYTNDEFISRFMEDVIAKNDKEVLPGYIMGSSHLNKYSRGSYRTIAKNLTAYRKKYGKNPSSLKVSYERISLHNYLTNEGCKGLGQCTPYFCACNSLQQSFYRLTGILVPESTIAGWAGTTEDGTGHDGINTAVAAFNKKYKKQIVIEWYNFSELGWAGVEKLMKQGALFFHLLYRDLYGHYEVPKSIGDVLKILNSLGDYCNYPAYCGYIETRSKSTQKSYISGISQKSVAFLYIE